MNLPKKLMYDKDISNGAKLLVLIILDAPEKIFYNDHLTDLLNCSKDSLYKYQNELIENKYITKVQIKDENGRFSYSVININEL